MKRRMRQNVAVSLALNFLVESKLFNANNDESPVIYRLKRIDGKWKVYDAVIANVSIVNNYRSQFDRVISKSSFEELKRVLRKKAG